MISENFNKLFSAAKIVRRNAHVPYSKFKVGAAFLAEDGSIITGCNVENAAYPQSQCAEASAIGNLISSGHKKITEIVPVPVIASGGAGKISHIEECIKECNVDGVAIAHLIHYNKTTITNIKKYLIKRNIPIRSFYE